MSASKTRTGWAIASLSAPLLILAGLSVYVGGYFGMSVATWEINNTKVRVYKAAWQRRAFWLGAAVESTLTGKGVYVSSSDMTVTD